MDRIDPRITRHLVGAGLGLAAAAAMAFLVVKAMQGTDFLSLLLLASHAAPGMMPATSFPAPHAEWLAAAELAAAAAIGGTLAGNRQISPIAALIAALPFLGIELYLRSSIQAQIEVLRQVPASLMPGAQDAIFSGGSLALGGAFAVAAAMPWRWRARPPRLHGPNWHAFGVLAGMTAVPVLWYVLQLTVVVSGVLPPVRMYFPGEGIPLMLVGGVIIGLLASARWLSPVAAVITGAPLLAVGVFTLLAPGAAQAVIDRLVPDFRWQLATESLAASGWLVLFGGMLLAAGSMPWRWRRGQPDTPDKFRLPPAMPRDTTLE